MPIIHRHLLKAFLRYLGYTLVGSLVLFIVLDLLGHSTSLLDNDATPSMVFRFYLYKSAFIVDTVMPIAMLMATLFTVGSMARYLELSALFSSGWSLMYVTRPLVVLAVLASLGSLAWREYVLPEANLRRYRVWEVEIHKNPDRIKPTSDISLTGPGGRLYHADKFDPNTGILTGLKVVTTEGARVLERIDAQRAEWDGQNWTLVDGVRRRFTDQGEDITHFERLTAGDLQVNPKSFYRERVRQEDMNIRQLREHVALTEQSGGDPTTGLVDIQYNLAFPLINLIVVLIGIILASGHRKTTIASGFGLTLLVCFGYYLFINFGKALGHNGTVPPLPAAWGGNLFFGLLFLILFRRARR